MKFGGIVTSPRGALSPLQALELARLYLENACKANDPDIALVLCHDTEMSLSQAKRAAKNAEDHPVRKAIGAVYIDLGKLLHSRGHGGEAQVSYKKAGKLGYVHENHFFYLSCWFVVCKYQQSSNGARLDVCYVAL